MNKLYLLFKKKSDFLDLSYRKSVGLRTLSKYVLE